MQCAEHTQGWHFHLGQALYRKISTLGFRERYNTDPSFSLKIRKLTALAFLPPNDVIEAYEDLIDDDDFSNDLITYFDVTYIGVAKGRADRRRRQNPMFPISVWNVRQRVLEDLPRTNNPLESFHHHFNSAAGANHANIWKLILQMKKEEAYQTTRMEHLRRGDSLKKNSKYSAINERLKNLVSTHGRAWGGGQGVLTPPKFWKAPFVPPKFWEEKKNVYNNNKE